MQPWPLEEALLAPGLALALAAGLPQLTARLLGLVFLRAHVADSEQRARMLVPFRIAALLVGLGQLQLIWMVAVRSVGPTLVAEPGAWQALVFAGLATVVGFVSGGVARRIEEPPDRRASALGVALLRARLVPLVAGPAIAAVSASLLPMTVVTETSARVVWAWALCALVLTALGVMFGGLVLALVTGALRPASEPVHALAHDVARREGARLALVLRLRTAGAHFANAAAIPWARTMIVTDGIVELLTPLELRAVLAHEAGHLTEGPRVAVARLTSAVLLLFALTSGVRIAATLGGGAAMLCLFGVVLFAVATLVAARRLARRMEERADARARQTVGPEPLAAALRRIHEQAQMPMVTGARRVHPDLWDRLTALGADPGPRPAPPARKSGVLVALATLALIGGAATAVELSTDVTTQDAAVTSEDAARWRMRIDPWDSDAMMALAWRARDAEALDRAQARAGLAAQMGPDAARYYELWAELHAARGDCQAARESFRRSMSERATGALDDALDRPLSLGGFRLPPTLVSRCGLDEP